MNLLQYKSNEMISSTELIRKSKSIFNKIQKKEIEKAVILRDGKPQFMLLDFETYEKLMTEYLSFKENKEKIKKEEVLENTEIAEEDIQKAFDEIEKLNLEPRTVSSTKNIEITVDDIIEEEIKNEEEPLKEFWEK
ncbi:hypothetical protein CP965_09050 [Halarcobacter mediterraneus]|uniref:Antitoxin n=1 Tax=Halarcobacter mediterraneus TaxID=2023153 RepID=A0A4Q1ASQ2_9BACT|nr:hypothetical protein [Halarcobacter mediterraneus]RXK12713.1 hypothetical protein CP965_09050 [Halarcobacter mediterraneus]